MHGAGVAFGCVGAGAGWVDGSVVEVGDGCGPGEDLVGCGAGPGSGRAVGGGDGLPGTRVASGGAEG